MAISTTRASEPRRRMKYLDLINPCTAIVRSSKSLRYNSTIDAAHVEQISTEKNSRSVNGAFVRTFSLKKNISKRCPLEGKFYSRKNRRKDCSFREFVRGRGILPSWKNQRLVESFILGLFPRWRNLPNETSFGNVNESRGNHRCPLTRPIVDETQLCGEEKSFKSN